MTDWPLAHHIAGTSRRPDARLARVFAAVLLAGCGSTATPDSPMHGNGPRATIPDGSTFSILFRGRILPDSLVLEPVFLLPETSRSEPEDEGPHRITGFDAAGAVLFDTRFEATAVMDGEPVEEHFHLMLPIREDRARDLHRVEIRAGDGRSLSRTARHSAEELRTALQTGQVVSARRVSERRVRLAWDGERFPALMIRDPGTGQILAFGRGGATTVSMKGSRLEVAISDGVQSAHAIVTVP